MDLFSFPNQIDATYSVFDGGLKSTAYGGSGGVLYGRSKTNYSWTKLLSHHFLPCHLLLEFPKQNLWLFGDVVGAQIITIPGFELLLCHDSNHELQAFWDGLHVELQPAFLGIH